jgi:hypothetical protein
MNGRIPKRGRSSKVAGLETIEFPSMGLDEAIQSFHVVRPQGVEVD